MSEILIPLDREARTKALPSLFKFLENLGDGRWKVTYTSGHTSIHEAPPAGVQILDLVEVGVGVAE